MQHANCMQGLRYKWTLHHNPFVLVIWLIVKLNYWFYWFICMIKQDILQITILYHVGSPVDNDGQADADSLPIARLHFAAKKYKLCYFIISGFIFRLS